MVYFGFGRAAGFYSGAGRGAVGATSLTAGVEVTDWAAAGVEFGADTGGRRAVTGFFFSCGAITSAGFKAAVMAFGAALAGLEWTLLTGLETKLGAGGADFSAAVGVVGAGPVAASVVAFGRIKALPSALPSGLGAEVAPTFTALLGFRLGSSLVVASLYFDFAAGVSSVGVGAVPCFGENKAFFAGKASLFLLFAGSSLSSSLSDSIIDFGALFSGMSILSFRCGKSKRISISSFSNELLACCRITVLMEVRGSAPSGTATTLETSIRINLGICFARKSQTLLV